MEYIMKTRFVAGALALTFLAGCGTKEVVVVQAPAPTDASTTTAAPIATIPPAPTKNPEDDFLERVAMGTDLTSVMTDNELVRFGLLVCQYFDEGGTSDGLAQILYQAGVQNGLSESEMGQFAVLAGIAVDEFCPENWPLVQA